MLHGRPTVEASRRSAVAPRARVCCRSSLSDEEIASLRAEYDEWIQRDPEVREPMFWEQVERAKKRMERVRIQKEQVAEQLSTLRDVLSVWQAFSGIRLVTAEKEITASGWALTACAALGPVVALQYVSVSGRRALSTLADNVNGQGQGTLPGF